MNKDKILLDGMVSKGADVRELKITDDEMAKINDLTLEPLESDDVYVFKVSICDNDIDRQHERFTLKAIDEMAGLFVGKPLIKDHDRKADNQIGRIYATEVITSETEKTEIGEPYTKLVAHCYILNTETNKDLLSDIKGGIKKEVSVNLRVSSAKCSICGTDNAKSYCDHYWGQVYGGEKCHFELGEPIDAFEVSFVAVPAQAKAGTMKEYSDKQQKAGKTDDTEKNEIMNGAQDIALKIKALDAYVYIHNHKNKEEL